MNSDGAITVRRARFIVWADLNNINDVFSFDFITLILFAGLQVQDFL